MTTVKSRFMRTRQPVITLILLVLALQLRPQTNLESIDSFASRVGFPDSLSIAQLTYRLTDSFTDPISKTRAIFAWIATNIKYDCPAFYVESRRKNKPEEVFKFKKAVCAGYANLFMEMCSHAKIQCLTVDGFARTSDTEAGEMMDLPNHTWNVVRINNEWKLVDVTWASGFTDKKVKVFTPHYTDDFFFTDPAYFLLSHYPKLSSWKLTRSSVSLNEFFNSPVVLSGYPIFNIVSLSPKKGLLKIKPHEPFTISITFQESNTYEVNVLSGENKQQKALYPTVAYNGNTMVLSFKSDKPGKLPFFIFLNGLPVVKYDVEVL